MSLKNRFPVLLKVKKSNFNYKTRTFQSLLIRLYSICFLFFNMIILYWRWSSLKEIPVLLEETLRIVFNLIFFVFCGKTVCRIRNCESGVISTHLKNSCSKTAIPNNIKTIPDQTWKTVISSHNKKPARSIIKVYDQHVIAIAKSGWYQNLVFINKTPF